MQPEVNTLIETKSASSEKVVALEAQYLFPIFKRAAFFPVRGEGVWLYDSAGKRYLDLLSGIATNALGANHPRIVAAINRQAGLTHVSNLFFHPSQGLLAETLCRLSGMTRVFFCNSGTEASEAAMKMARGLAFKRGETGRGEFVALENAFHGRTLGALTITHGAKYRDPFEPLVPGVRFVPANDLERLAEAVTEKTAAVFIEPIQGEGGIIPLSVEFLRGARQLCDRQGALLVFDEIQCGLGRTGSWFVFQDVGVKPDLVLLAKSLGCGFPLAAVLGTERVRDALGPGEHGTTFGGGPLACSVSLEFLRVLEEENLLDHVRQVGAYLRTRLEALKEKKGRIQEIRSAGLMVGIDFGQDATGLVPQLLGDGFVTNCTHQTVLRLLPPLILEQEHVDLFVDALEKRL